jgi:hypothetical protein
MDETQTFTVEFKNWELEILKELIKDKVMMIEAAVAIENWGDEQKEKLRDQSDRLQDLYLKVA